MTFENYNTNNNNFNRNSLNNEKSSKKNEIIPLSASDEIEFKGQSKHNENDRQNWGNRFEFLLACIGYSVGLGIFKKAKDFYFIFFLLFHLNFFKMCFLFRQCMEIWLFVF